MKSSAKKTDYKTMKKKIDTVVNHYQYCLMRISYKEHPTMTEDKLITMHGINQSEEIASEEEAFVANVIDCLLRMSEKYRVVLWFSFFQPMAHLDLAEVMEISSSQLSVLKRKAREHFVYGLGLDQ